MSQSHGGTNYVACPQHVESLKQNRISFKNV